MILTSSHASWIHTRSWIGSSLRSACAPRILCVGKSCASRRSLGRRVPRASSAFHAKALRGSSRGSEFVRARSLWSKSACARKRTIGKPPRRESAMSADAIVVLEAMLSLLRLGAVEQAETYAETALAAYRQAPPTPPTDPPARTRGKTSTERSRAYRAAMKAARQATDATANATDATLHATAPVAPVRSRGDLNASDLPKTSTEEIREFAREPRDHATDATPNATASVAPLGERPPPSGTPVAEVEGWCRARGLDPSHPSMARFLDIRRNAKPRSDWPGCWRLFLEDEASGRFEHGSGIRKTVVQTDPPGQRAWKVGK